MCCTLISALFLDRTEKNEPQHWHLATHCLIIFNRIKFHSLNCASIWSTNANT